jgi:hypothetical protein
MATTLPTTTEIKSVLLKLGCDPEDVPALIDAVAASVVKQQRMLAGTTGTADEFVTFSEGSGTRRGAALSAAGRKLASYLRETNPRVAARHAV